MTQNVSYLLKSKIDYIIVPNYISINMSSYGVLLVFEGQ